MNYTLQSRQEDRFSVLELSHEVTVNQLNTMMTKARDHCIYRCIL